MTLRIPDTVKIGGTTFFTRCCPPLPPARFLREPTIRAPKSSANHRGYTSRWLVRDGRLHLMSVQGLQLRMGKPGPHPADWVGSMTLTLPLGERVPELGHRYSPVYEADLELRIAAGEVTGWRLVRNPCKRRPPWQPGFPWPEIRRRLTTENLLP